MKKCKNPCKRNFRSGRKVLGFSQGHMQLQALCWELLSRKLKMFCSGLEHLEQLSLETHSPDKSQLFQGLETSVRPLALTQPEQEHRCSVSERETIEKIHILKGRRFQAFYLCLTNLVLATSFLPLFCYENIMQIEQCLWTLSVILFLSIVQTSTTQFLAHAWNKGPSLLP